VQYRPDIDGLRAVAVLAVVAHHAFPDLLPGGFVGVDIFFVISGYLITRDILERQAAGTFTLADFYRRRVRRIFPALVVVLAATLLAGSLLLFKDEFERLIRHTLASALFAQNFVLLGESGYFAPAAQLLPLLHLWSLAVEEQFYLVWPLLLGLGLRLRWTQAMMVSSFVLLLWLVAEAPAAAYYLPLSPSPAGSSPFCRSPAPPCAGSGSPSRVLPRATCRCRRWCRPWGQPASSRRGRIAGSPPAGWCSSGWFHIRCTCGTGRSWRSCGPSCRRRPWRSSSQPSWPR
jgi:hypothetical protein